MWVFGGGEEGADDDEDDAGTGQKRRALGTAVLLTSVVAGTGTAVVCLAPEVFSTVVTGDPSNVSEIRWAAVSGGLGALWRLLNNIPRFERRPLGFLSLGALRPTLVLCLSVPLVVEGYGVEGALAGIALGTAGSALVGLLVTRRSFLFALDRDDLVQILRRGGPFVPVILSFWIIQNLDVYLLSVFTSDAQAGLYRVASRLASVVSYFVSAFVMAWMPLSRTAIHAATERERGESATNAALLTYFMFAASWLVLALAVFSELLIGVAARSYADAAPLVPAVALGFVAYGAFILVYRSARFRRKRAFYVAFTVMSAVIFLLLALVLIPVLGSYGAALAHFLGFAAGCVGLLVISQRGRHPLPLSYPRIGSLILLAAVLFAATLWLGTMAGALAPVVGTAVVVLFPIAVFGTGLLPRAQGVALWQIVRGTLPTAAGPRQTLSRLRGLDPDERGTLELLVKRRRPLPEVAEMSMTSEPVLLHRFVAALRSVGEIGHSQEGDAGLGAYLLSTEAVAERDRMAKRLWTEGVEPQDIDALELTLARLRRIPNRAWAPH